MFVKTWGIFVPLVEQHRILSVGIKLGISYTEAIYQINICDPYQISSKTKKRISIFSFRDGFCLNDKELYSAGVSHVSTTVNITIKTYSYIGDRLNLIFLVKIRCIKLVTIRKTH